MEKKMKELEKLKNQQNENFNEQLIMKEKMIKAYSILPL